MWCSLIHIIMCFMLFVTDSTNWWLQMCCPRGTALPNLSSGKYSLREHFIFCTWSAWYELKTLRQSGHRRKKNEVRKVLLHQPIHIPTDMTILQPFPLESKFKSHQLLLSFDQLKHVHSSLPLCLLQAAINMGNSCHYTVYMPVTCHLTVDTGGWSWCLYLSWWGTHTDLNLFRSFLFSR